MRLQLLGDARDSFKWDCIHFLVSKAQTLQQLLVVPMRCDDVPQSSEGKIPPERFRARPEVARFLNSLREEPRSFQQIASLGALDGLPCIDVQVYQPDRLLGYGWQRAAYWTDLHTYPFAKTFVFLDPDTGFESKSQAGERHLRFGEVHAVCTSIRDRGVLAVYHHRGQGQSWADVLRRLWESMPPELCLRAIYGGDVALVLLGHIKPMENLDGPIRAYIRAHPQLRVSDDGSVQ